MFQRTPSSIDVRDDWPTDPEWAAKRPPDWQTKRRAKIISKERETAARNQSLRNGITREEKIRRQENANIDAMMRIHRRIDETVEDPATADSLKPWYMIMCKRPCFHNDYLPTFNRPNVHLVDTHGEGITKITPQGPEFHGKVYELDVLIYATGFEVQQTGIYNRIVGEHGDRPAGQVRRRHPHAARDPHPRLPEPVHHGRLPGVVPVQPDRPVAGARRSHRQLHRPRPPARASRRSTARRRPRRRGSRRSSPTAARPTATPSARPATTTSRASSTGARTATTTAASPRTCDHIGRIEAEMDADFTFTRG